MKVGFVFKANGKLHISEYLGNNNFSDGFPIDNHEPYKELKEDQLAFVEITSEQKTKEGDVAYTLVDHGFYTLECTGVKNIKGHKALTDLNIRDNISKFIEGLRKRFYNEN